MGKSLDEMLLLSEELKKEINELNWEEGDVRLAFFEYFYAAYYDFYLGHIELALGGETRKGNIKFDERIISLKDHVQRFVEATNNEYLKFGMKLTLNRGFLFSVWTSFELSVSFLFDAISTEIDREGLFKKMNMRLIKFIEKEEDESKRTSLIKDLKRVSFTPLIRKFNYIVSLNSESYTKKRDLEKDRELLDLANTLRNVLIHANGYYVGSEKSINFQSVRFKFIPNQFFIMEGELDQKEIVIRNLIFELRKIFTALIENTADLRLIDLPSEEL